MTSFQEVNKLLREKNIEWVQIHFTDVYGRLRAVSSPVKEYTDGDVWKSGIGIDGSSIEGFGDVFKSDMVALPDPNTLKTLPLSEEGVKEGIVTANIYTPDGKRFDGDPRYIAERAMDRAKAMGYDCVWMSAELEFFLFKNIISAIIKNENQMEWAKEFLSVYASLNQDLNKLNDHFIKSKKGYLAAHDETKEFRDDFSSLLLEMGIPVKYHHHEGGSEQIEIEFKALPSPVKVGDAAILYKYLARRTAKKYGLTPTFMPKPVSSDAGNGMHVHQHLTRDKKPCFYDENDEYRLSQTARYYIGGLLDHACAMSAITNPTINSYRRLVPGFEAPVYACWSPINRSALIRVPAHATNPEEINCEARHPDASSNPYFTFAVLLQCGLDGIKRKIDPGDPINENVYKLPKKRRKELGIKQLPRSLKDALQLLETDDVVQRAIGSHVFDSFIRLKNKEWERYYSHVPSWDIYEYFDI